MIINLRATAGTARFHYRFDQREVLVGRAETVDLRLPHPSVSLVHLCLRLVKGKLWANDRGSTNGTALDGVPLVPEEPVPAPPGSRLTVGIFELVIGEPESGELTAPGDMAGFARRMVLEILGEGDFPALVVQNGSNRGERLEIASGGVAQVVGRDTGCDLRLGDADASRKHMEVRRHDGLVQVRDLDSKNGIRVDGAHLEGWQPLAHGAKVKVGKTVLRFCDPAETYLRDLEEESGDGGAGAAGQGDGQGDEATARRLRQVDLVLVTAGVALVLGVAGLILYLAGWL